MLFDTAITKILKTDNIALSSKHLKEIQMISANSEKCVFTPDTLESATPQAEFSLVFYTALTDGVKMVKGVTQHAIDDGVMGVGKYVSPNHVSELLNDNMNKTLTLNPPNLLAENANTLVWYTPPVQEDMWFRVSSKVERVNAQWCSLLFVAKKTGGLFVFALMDSHPNENSKVYHAPLMNIGSNGGVCQGTARLPKDISLSTMDEVRSTIFESNFSHVNHNHTLSPLTKKSQKDDKISTKNLLSFWKKKQKNNEPVKADELVEFDTLKNILARHS